MGIRERQFIIYTFAATFIVLLALAFSGGTRKGSVFSFLRGYQPTTTRTDFLNVPSSKYAVTRYNHSDEQPSEKIYRNDYRPSTTYARAYVEPTEVKHPLIASAKFVSKQDKLKKAKKKSKKLLAKNKKKKGTSSSNNEDDDDFFEEEDESSSISGGTTPIIGAVGPRSNPKKQKEEEEKSMNTVEFWEKPIFIEEDYKAVVKLIENYQIRKVSNNVFYTLVDDMTHDERPNLREYGLIALTATPSAKSFSELAWMKHNDNTTDIRSNAGKEITNYSLASRTNHVVSALRTSSDNTPKATIEALSVLTATSKKYISVIELGNNNPEPVDTTGLAQLEPRLDTALQIIQEKYVNSPDPKIKSAADKTVAAINDFIAL